VERATEEICWSEKARRNIERWCLKRRATLNLLDEKLSNKPALLVATISALKEIQIAKVKALESTLQRYGTKIAIIYQQFITEDVLVNKNT